MARAARAGWLKFSSSKLGTTGDSNHRKHLPTGHGGGPQVGAGRQLLVAGRNDTSGGLDPRHSGRNLGRGGACRLTFCALVLRRFGSVGAINLIVEDSLLSGTNGTLSRLKTKCMDHYTLSGPGPSRFILSYGE